MGNTVKFTISYNGKEKEKKKPGKKEILLLIVVCFLMVAGMFYGYFSEDSPEKSSVSGVFNAYQEQKRRVNKSTKTYYFVLLDGIKYNIPRIYIKALNKTSFLTEVKPGDSLSLELDGPKSIYQITKGEVDYIDPVILKEEKESNNFVGLILGCFFTGCLIYLIYFYTKL